MIESASLSQEDQSFRQAAGLWVIFFLVTILINGTVPFILGADLQAWTYSTLKDVLVHTFIYAGLFLFAPLILVKGWPCVRQPSFLVPLSIVGIAIVIQSFAPVFGIIVVIVLAYLHLRYDLSGMGFQSKGWKGDLVAILLLGLIQVIPSLISLSGTAPHTLTPGAGFSAGMGRLFTNPASTVENLFYFGFLAERFSLKIKPWLTAALIGILYTFHEMTNPEYWYEGSSFVFILIGVTIFAAIYLWRRSVIVIWLGDGLGKILRF